MGSYKNPKDEERRSYSKKDILPSRRNMTLMKVRQGEVQEIWH